jgi:NAD(P)-dependent dehydrogenase (short-subunit alcohol dehydrogenase family)
MTVPQTALVTGAAKRIGRAIALSLANAGWNIAIHYHHSADDAHALKHELLALGVRAITVQADLCNESQVQSIIPQVINQLGNITCLVNNASSFHNDTLATNTRALWDTHMEVNLRAPVLLMQQFAVQLPQGTQGNIINMLDYAVWKLPEKKFFSYAISKSGLWAATQMLALELAPHVRVNAIGPGPTLANNRQTASSFQKACEQSPLQHGSSPEEVCRVIAFLLATPSITGQMIALDNGLHLANEEYC